MTSGEEGIPGEQSSREGTVDEVLRGEAAWCIVHGDDERVDAAVRQVTQHMKGVTDPPYSSGGAFRGDRVGASSD
jgi:hypothetical protein